MSWYVRYLLSNSVAIRERVVNPTGFSFNDSFLGKESENLDPDDDEGYVVGINDEVSLDDDDFFNDLLLVEKCIKTLYDRGAITTKDVEILKTLNTDPAISKLESELGSGRFELTDRFTYICNLVAKTLGGIFSNDGYVEYLSEKYKLDDAHVRILREFIESNTKI